MCPVHRTPHGVGLAAGALVLSLTLAAEAALAASAALVPDLAVPSAAPFVAPASPPRTDLGTARRLDPPPVAARTPGALPAGVVQAALVGGAAGWTYESDVANRMLGLGAVPAGDLNGDGTSDFVALGDVNSFYTALYVFLGGAGGPTLAAGFPVTNLPAGAQVAPGGDVNGDGRDDIVLFWYLNGSARVYFGSASGLDMVNYNALNSHFGTNLIGFNAAPAGDVNGDGYGDLIFGMPNLSGFSPCTPSAGSGVAEVLYGSATGVSASRNWYVTGCYATGAGAGLGTSVAGAGDVNGDGYDDIVIGAPGAELNLVGTVGKVYVLYGSATGLPLLPGYSNQGAVTYGTTIAGHHLYGTFGNTVAGAGDLNGDGYADIAVGAPYDDQYGSDAGMAFVFRGSAAGADSATANLLWWESAGTPGAQFGMRLAPAGDVNGDGRPDLLVGETSRVDLAQSAGGTLLIEQLLAYPASSTRVATAGDVNGDGLSDLLVGDPYWSNGQASEGRVLVHYGVGSPPSAAANWSLTQTAIDNPNLGWSVASAGDVNGDGYEDVLVGEPTWYDFTTPGATNNGLVQLFYGHSSGLSTSSDWYAYGASGDQLGISVAGGDVNGDGYSDLVVGAHTSAGGLGQARIWYGGPGGPSTSGPNVSLTGASAGAQFGASVACAGDVDGDGYPDVVVGAPMGQDPASPLPGEGRAYVYRGGAAGLATSPSWSRSGGQADAHLGSAVAGAGDVNGDAFADVVIGEPDYDSTNRLGDPVTDAGRVFVVFGSPSGPASEATSTSVTPWRYGAAVAGAGDVNGDGYRDVVIGATSATGSFANEGAVRVLAGAPGGLGDVLWTQYGGEAYGGFGSAVSSAGDVDGDGLSDVLVGAVFQDMGGPQDQGRAYVYRGPLTAGAAPFWTASGGSSFANLGHALANAGDVNGDGWSDLVFGEPGYTSALWRQGYAQVRYGARGLGSFQLAFAYHSTAPAHLVQPGCLSDPGAVIIGSTLRSAAGRAKVRMQYRLTPAMGLSAPAVAGFTSWVATGTPGANGSTAGAFGGSNGLVDGVPYAWQVRSLARSVYYPTGPWRSPVRSGRLETDARVPGTWVGVPAPASVAGLMLAEPAPNPMVASASIAFTTSRPGPVTIEVLDVQGRRVRTLAHRTLPAGPHRLAWDGRADDGHAAGAGLYLVRMEAEGRVLGRKLVRVR